MGFSVFTLTWNAEGNTPRGDLSDLLRRNPPPDVYAIGIQEMEKAERERYYTSSSKKAEKEHEWQESLENSLPGYIRLTTVKHEGIVLFIYVHQSLTPVIENLETKTCAFYARSEHGPKGAVAARFEMGGFSFCFANCHLSSRTETVEQRDQEFRLIWDVLKFPSGYLLHDHDHVFMLGILNYRAEVGEVVDGFAEPYIPPEFRSNSPGPIRFHGHDPQMGLPPGCDRILYKANDWAMKVEEYEAHSYYRLSEYKPVSGLFRFIFPTYCEIKNSEAWNT
jgi:hypothetical protein